MAFIKSHPDQPIGEDERKQTRDCTDLAMQLEDANPIARRWATRDLIDCPDASTLLVGRLQREEDVSVRGVILTALTSLGDKTAIAGLVDCLRSEDVALRNEALEAMKQLSDKVAPIMRVLLNDADPDVRIFAVNILESLRHPDVESWLISVIEHDTHLNVCATAVDLLGEVGSIAALEPLQRLKSRYANEPYIQFAADLAMNRITHD